jgi:hypothetical protein
MGSCVAEIQYIARILRNKNLCLDISPLTNGYKKGKCNVEKLKFHIEDVPRNTKPKVSFLDILLDVTYMETNNTDIPISHYSFRITALGQSHEGLFQSSWHLDYDDNDGQEYIHPYFHLTWGGDILKDLNLGNVLLLPTPRISYPPMDVVLGIDFVLSNFVKVDIYRQIQNDSQYKAAVKNAQEKYWKPYMLSLAHHWCNNNCLKMQFNTIKAENFYATLVN